MAPLKVISLIQAAELLQPHMRRNALRWLLTDQGIDPQIPFRIVRGKRFYSASDVASYIVKFLNPNAVIPTDVPRDASFAQRKRTERRVDQLPLPAGAHDRRDPRRADRRKRSGE